MIPSATNLQAWAAWLDPIATLLVGAAVLLYIRRYLKPRLQEVEETQEERARRWEEQGIDSRERAILIDDNAERVNQLEEVFRRLRSRVSRLERQFAAEHGHDLADSHAPEDDETLTDGHGGVAGQPPAPAWDRDHPDLLSVRRSTRVQTARECVHQTAEEAATTAGDT
jgi:hypothetical protein